MNLWLALVPLALVSALLPVPILVTVLLLGTSRAAATGWLLGMAVVRLVQGVVFGLVLTGSPEVADDPSELAVVKSTLLLLVGVLFYVAAGKALFMPEDPDAPPPAWMTKAATLTPVRAFLLGAGFLLVSAKFWALTLSAISAIAAADLGRGGGLVAYLVFVLLAGSVNLVLVLSTVLAPARSPALVAGLSGWLERNNSRIVVALGAVFGTMFLLEALAGFGLI